MRQRILYAEQMWHKQRIWALVLVVGGLAMSSYLIVYVRQPLNTTTYTWLAWLGSGLLLLAALHYYRIRAHVHVRDDGLKISNLLSSVVIDYSMIRSVRVQPLQQHFTEGRKRLIRPVSKPLLDKPALFIRLRGDDAAISGIARKLGSQLAAHDTIALPLADPDAVAWEVTARLPDKTGVNLGGGRRRKKRR